MGHSYGSLWVLKMQVTDPTPKELDLVAVVSWVVKMGIMNSANGENLVVIFSIHNNEEKCDCEAPFQ